MTYSVKSTRASRRVHGWGDFARTQRTDARYFVRLVQIGRGPQDTAAAGATRRVQAQAATTEQRCADPRRQGTRAAGALAGALGSQRRSHHAPLCTVHADRGELPGSEGSAAWHRLAPVADTQGPIHGAPDAACTPWLGVLAWRRGLLASQQAQNQRLLAHGQAIQRAARARSLYGWPSVSCCCAAGCPQFDRSPHGP